jgi:hypothetical protein
VAEGSTAEHSFNTNFVAAGTKPRHGSPHLPEPLLFQFQASRAWKDHPVAVQGVTPPGSK